PSNAVACANAGLALRAAADAMSAMTKRWRIQTSRSKFGHHFSPRWPGNSRRILIGTPPRTYVSFDPGKFRARQAGSPEDYCGAGWAAVDGRMGAPRREAGRRPYGQE